jgi:hypothetical protein
MPVTAILVLTAVLSLLPGCGREEQQPDQTAAKEQQEQEAKEEEQKHKAALGKSLELCNGIKWLFEQRAVSEPEDDAEYDYVRERCLDGLADRSRDHLESEEPAERALRVFVSRDMLEDGYACMALGRKCKAGELWEMFRKEAIKSGRWRDTGNPEAYMFKLRLILRPGCQVAEDDLAPLIVTALKQGIWKVAVLPPFTVQEEERFLEELESERKE